MSLWQHSVVMKKDLDRLVDAGLLRPLIEGNEWLVPEQESSPEWKVGYIVSFVHFYERGVGVPPHDFFCAVLFHYGCELDHLNPNGIQQVSTFLVLCEDFLGVSPNFTLWKHFFSTRLMWCRLGSGDDAALIAADIGSVSI